MTRMRIAVAVTLLSAACGRLGFEGAAASGGDDDIDAPPSMPDGEDPGPAALLACDTPVRFPIGATALTAMAATKTTDGFAVFGVQSTGRLAGWRFRVDAAGVVGAGAQDVAIDTDIADGIGAVASGNDILLASITGRAAPTGSRLYPLDGALGLRGAAQSYGDFAGTVPLAEEGGDLVLVTSRSTRQVDVQRVSKLGVQVGASKQVAAPTRIAGSVVIGPTADGYGAAWVSAIASPNAVEVAHMSLDLDVAGGPVSFNPTAFDPTQPRIAWLKDADAHLVVWYVKNATNDDDVWIQRLDGFQQPIGTPAMIASFSYGPEVVSDKTGFVIAWNNYAAGKIETVRVDAAGNVSPPVAVGPTGVGGQWKLVERLGQAVLLWSEAGSDDVSISAICPQP